MTEAAFKQETVVPYKDDDDNTNNDFLIRWEPLVSALKETAVKAYEAYKELETPSDEDVQECLRDTYLRFLSTTTNNIDIPYYATTPPIHNVHIFLFNDNESKICPCCLPDVFASVEVHNPLGVTKDDILREVINFLYNSTTPSIYNADGSSTVQKGMIVSASDWTCTGANEKGEALAHVQSYGAGYELVELVFYCCKVENFGENGSKGDREK